MIIFRVVYVVSLNKNTDQFQCSLHEYIWRPLDARRRHKMLKTPPGVHRCITATDGNVRRTVMGLV